MNYDKLNPDPNFRAAAKCEVIRIGKRIQPVTSKARQQ